MYYISWLSKYVFLHTSCYKSYHILFSLFDSDDNEDKNIESDMLYPVDIENVTNRNDGIQVLKESDVGIVDDIKQRVPFAPVPSKYGYAMVCWETGVYLPERYKQLGRFFKPYPRNKYRRTKEEHVEDSNISEITTDACVGSPCDPPGLSFEDIGEDMNDSLFVKNVWASCKLWFLEIIIQYNKYSM